MPVLRICRLFAQKGLCPRFSLKAINYTTAPKIAAYIETWAQESAFTQKVACAASRSPD